MNFFAWLKSLFAPTVDSIVADIAAKAAKLHIIADIKAVEAETHAREIAVRATLQRDALNVVVRAKAVAAKFEALVS